MLSGAELLMYLPKQRTQVEDSQVWTARDFPPEPPRNSKVSLSTYQRFRDVYLGSQVEECYLTSNELQDLREQGCRSWKQYLLRVNLRNFE